MADGFCPEYGARAFLTALHGDKGGPVNGPSLWWFFKEVRWRWLKTLKRRSQKADLN